MLAAVTLLFYCWDFCHSSHAVFSNALCTFCLQLLIIPRIRVPSWHQRKGFHCSFGSLTPMLSDPRSDSGTCLQKKACGFSVSKYKHPVRGRNIRSPHVNISSPVFSFLFFPLLSEQAKFVALLYDFLDPSSDIVMQQVS